MTKLTKLAEKWLKQGYDLDYVRKYLADYGYKKKEIDAALKEAQFISNTKQKPKHDPHESTVFLVLALIIVSILALAVVKLSSMEEPIPEIKPVEKIELEEEPFELEESEPIKEFQNTDCDSIDNINRREDCIMELIQQGNDHLCAKIELPKNREYCERIERIQLLAKY